MLDDRGPGARRAGFTLMELMVSITVLFLGVIAAGVVLVAVQRGANLTETRYQDYSDLRVRAEGLKAELSTGVLQPGNRAALFPAQFRSASGHGAQTHYEVGAAGLPNLVWVEMTVEQEGGGDPIVFNTYLRANE
jgi:hypothetical protein